MQDNGINIRHLLYWALHRIHVVKMHRLNVHELYACTGNEWLGEGLEELSRVCACRANIESTEIVLKFVFVARFNSTRDPANGFNSVVDRQK